MVFPFLKSSAIATFLALLFLCILHSEPSKAQAFTPALKKVAEANRNTFSKKDPTEGKLHIVAVMVEFQEDENRLTTGSGIFGESGMPFLNNPDIRIDPLPHDKRYFEAHLEFAKNYFETMSNGSLKIDFTVIPEIIKLSKEMSRYSPTGRQLNFLPAAELAAETWESVNRLNLIDSLPPSDPETAFIIFHAGAGRDIELVGTTLNKTPQDIPSVYLSKESFRNIFNDPAFEGFPLDKADAIVNNTLILPRTLSRPGEDVSGNQFVLQLSLNGLVTAQIGSHIGLPDLFDTESGRSGIGRFGLMDGAGIFSYNGLFPPEMSAWEKVYLGWIKPQTVSPYSDNTAELPAVSKRQFNSVLKIELSKSEYFLIENRHRDPDGDGVTLEIQKPDGSTVLQTFTNSDQAFTFQEQGYEQLLEPGVITSVSDYDFSLPGGLFDENDNPDVLRELNGGILIWHIDENIIQENIASNTINTGPGPNGITLMEADAAQDIGNPISNGLFNNNSNGWAFDFWWSGNNASVVTQTDSIQLYQNRFGPDTTPSNRSNTGASAGFELFNFSDNLPVASLSVRTINPHSSLYSEINTSELRSLPISPFTFKSDPYWQAYPLAIQPTMLDDEPHFIIPGSDGIEIINPRDVSLFNSGPQTEFPIQQPLWNVGNQQVTISENPFGRNEIKVESFTADDGNFARVWQLNTKTNAGFISESEAGIIDLDHTSEQISLSDGALIQSQNAVQKSERIGGISSRIEQNQLIIDSPNGEISHTIPEISDSGRKHTGIISQSNGDTFIYLLLDDLLMIYHNSDNFEDASILTDNTEIEWPAFGDIDGNGTVDILYVDKESNTLQAKTVTGATLPFFPLTAPDQAIFLGTPLLSDLDGDGDQDIILQTEISSSISLNAFDSEATILEGFPLLVGGGATEDVNTIHPSIFEKYLLAVSPDGELRLWNFPASTNAIWPAKYGEGENNKVSGRIQINSSNPTHKSFLVSEETYNWPNPANDYTNIRYLTSEPAKVDINIIAASGRLVYSKKSATDGGIAEEITVDTSKWSSGAYFAQIKAESANQTGKKTIRIAIAK